MIPTFWRVHWAQLGAEPAGHHDFAQRARARGFAVIRRASGFTVTIETITS